MPMYSSAARERERVEGGGVVEREGGGERHRERERGGGEREREREGTRLNVCHS